MSSMITAYRYFHQATQKLVNVYSPHICLNYLKLNDDAKIEQIYKNMEELNKYYKKPEFSYLIYNKKT